MSDPIKAVERRPGRTPIDPKILRALWLYSTSAGIGSARHRDELGREHVASPWLAGDGSTDYHTRADSRTDHVERLNDLLTKGVAALMAEGPVEWNRGAQAGRRVRARAGAASFRRRPTPEAALAEAQGPVEALRAEWEEGPSATDRRQKAARQRAARGRVEGIKRASERLPEWEARKEPQEEGRARGATTDAAATVLKMAAGGCRAAYNFQSATDTSSPVIVGVGGEATGRDAGQRVPRVDQGADRSGEVPPEWLVDGGWAQHDPIEAVSVPEGGCTGSAPVPQPKDPQGDRCEPQPSDRAAGAAWRERMATDQAQTIPKDRAATAGCSDAWARGRGSIRGPVRGSAQVEALAWWYALAHHPLRAAPRRAAVAGRG